MGQENGRVAGTAPGAAGRRFDSDTVVRSPELLAAEGGGKCGGSQCCRWNL